MPKTVIKVAPQHRRSRLAAWEPAPRTLTIRPGASEQLRVDPKLQRVIKALGLVGAAEVLDVDKGQLSRCAHGTEAIGYELARRVSEVEYVLERALRVMHEDEVGPWLISPEPLLGNSTPLNTLVLQGAAPVTQALESLYAGVLV